MLENSKTKERNVEQFGPKWIRLSGSPGTVAFSDPTRPIKVVSSHITEMRAKLRHDCNCNCKTVSLSVCACDVSAWLRNALRSRSQSESKILCYSQGRERNGQKLKIAAAKSEMSGNYSTNWWAICL